MKTGKKKLNHNIVVWLYLIKIIEPLQPDYVAYSCQNNLKVDLERLLTILDKSQLFPPTAGILELKQELIENFS